MTRNIAMQGKPSAIHVRGLYIVLVALVTLLAGCGGSSPGGFPDINTSRRIAGTECPDLTGTYRYQPDAGSVIDAGVTPMAMDREEGWSTLTLVSHPDGSFDFTRQMQPDGIRRSAMELRERDPETYMKWRALALDELDLTRDDAERALTSRFEALAALGPTPERSGKSGYTQCDDGWIGVERMVPVTTSYGGYYAEGTIWLTRDSEGGLLARWLAGERHEFTIWCGDGCKGIPYYTSTAKHWARFAPTQAPVLWQADAAQLPPWPAELSAEEIARREALAAARALPGLQSVPAPDARVPQLRQRVQAMLAPGDRIGYFDQDRDGVSISGRSESRANLDALMAAIRADAVVAKVDLVTFMANTTGPQPFSLAVRLKP